MVKKFNAHSFLSWPYTIHLTYRLMQPVLPTGFVCYFSAPVLESTSSQIRDLFLHKQGALRDASFWY